MVTKTYQYALPDFYVVEGVQHRIFASYAGFRTGVKVQGWRQKIRAGANATSPASYDVMYVDVHEPVNFTQRWGNFAVFPPIVYKFDGYPASISQHGFDHVTAPSAEDEAQALSRMYDKIRNESYGANGLLVIGELRETIHMLRNPLETLHTLVSDLLTSIKIKRREVRRMPRRRGESTKAHRNRVLQAFVDAVASSWLVFQFGVKPVISDIQEIASTIEDILTQPSRKVRLRAKSSEREAYELITFSQNSIISEGLTSTLLYQKLTSVKVQYVVGLAKTLAGPEQSVRSVASEFGFQIQNFIPTVYELIPWSFLADYFVNLGDIIEATCTDTSAVQWISRSSRQVTDFFHQQVCRPYVSESYPDSNLSGSTVGLRTFRRMTVGRTDPGSLPIPPLVFSVPGQNSDKWYNMAALLSSFSHFRVF